MKAFPCQSEKNVLQKDGAKGYLTNSQDKLAVKIQILKVRTSEIVFNP